MDSRALKILAVSGDRAALRHLIRFLTAFGYDVHSAADVAQAAAAIEADDVDFLIIDDRLEKRASDAYQRLIDDAKHSGRFTFLLLHGTDSEKVAEAIAAGVDDFLTYPLVYGELLARLRAAARALENRRRWAEQAEFEPTTGLPSQAAFRRGLKQQIDAARRSSKSVASAVLEIDFFDRVSRVHGHKTRCELLKQIARRLAKFVGPDHKLGCLGNDRFGLLLSDCGDWEAVAEVERICCAVSDAEFSCGDWTFELTASAGVACWGPDSDDADQLLQQAETALEGAKNSGRNCVVRYGQFSDETKAWHELAEPGRLLESTKARDVMTLCPVALHLDDPFHKATAAFEQTELLAIPVVDRAGELAGVVWRESFINGRDIHETYPASHLNGSLREQLDDSVECVEEEATFAELVERLSDESTTLLAVVDGRRPTGLISSPNLASLSQPLSTTSFQSSKQFSDTPEYLAVAEQA